MVFRLGGQRFSLQYQHELKCVFCRFIWIQVQEQKILTAKFAKKSREERKEKRAWSTIR
jgi:hypothetical protein